VVEDGPAAKAGLQGGDVIVAFDGKPEADFTTIRDALKGHEPGDVVAVTYLRNGVKADTSITLSPYSPQAFGMNFGFFNPDEPGSNIFQRFALSDQDMERIQSEIAELSAKLEQLSAELASAVGARAQELGKLSAELGQQIAAKAADLARRSAAEISARLWTDRDGPGRTTVRIVPDKEGAPQGIWVVPAPEAPAAPTPPTPGSASPAPSADAQSIAEMDARIRRIEQLLEQLAKQQGGGGNR